MRLSRFAWVLLAVCLSSPAQKDADWVGTWTTAAMPLPSSATSRRQLALGQQEVTVRQVVHISQGGKRLRVTFTNEFGTTPLHISAVHVAFLSAGSKILPETDKALTFSGKSDLEIPAGGFASSDAVTERVPIFSDLVITAVLPPQEMPVVTYHSLALATTWIAPGNEPAALEFDSPAAVPPGTPPPDASAPLRSVTRGEPPTAEPIVKPGAASSAGSGNTAAAASASPLPATRSTSWYFLKNVEVDRTRKSAALVTFGDSITDGARSTPETNRRWPDVLSPLLAANKKTAAMSVLNVGISGNRILHENTGPSAEDRLERDVLHQPGAKFVVLLEGINDIGQMHRSAADAMTEQQLIDGYTQLATRMHAAGLRVIGATLLPYEGAAYYSQEGEQIRQHVNAFLRTSTLFDGVIDFEKVVADPQQPTRMLPKYDSGDHLHPSDDGYAAMGAAIDLKLFRPKK